MPNCIEWVVAVEADAEGVANEMRVLRSLSAEVTRSWKQEDFYDERESHTDKNQKP